MAYQVPGQPITIDELKAYLWGAATLLRGQIDASGYKEYIFPLLFFKRISDVYDEQYSTFLNDSGGDNEYATLQMSDYPVQIPEGAHWNDVRKTSENVGQKLVEAFVRIEQANPPRRIGRRSVGGLNGIFGDKSGWTNKSKMPDSVIMSLIEHFSQRKLTMEACPADEMGLAYEYLVGQFANDAGHTAQEFYTNRTVVTLMAEILQPKPYESIYDPTCGTGGMLIKSLTYLKDKGEEWRSVRVYGQEVNTLTASIARMNLHLHGILDYSIANDDTLARPAFIEGDHLQKFDVVLANPPYSIKTWDRAAFSNDIWGRNFLGTPPQGRADYAFFQHILASMKDDTGRCAILFPHGVLFRDEEKDIRKKLIESDKVECVIGLGPNLFFNSPMESCIIICNNNKALQMKGKMLMINAVNEVVRKNGESLLLNEHIEKIANAYLEKKELEGFSKLVTANDVAEKNYNLNISLYVYTDIIETQDSIDFETSLAKWRSQSDSLQETYGKLINLLKQ
jgi:type I restriction enzyme M protein